MSEKLPLYNNISS